MESQFRQKYIWVKNRLVALLGGVPLDNCDQLHDFLSGYSDGELSDKERLVVEAHLEKCEACRTELAALKLTTSFIAARPSVVLSGEKSLQLHIALQEEMRGRSHFPVFGRPAWAFSGAAFAAVFAFGFLYLSHNNFQPGKSNHPVIAFLPHSDRDMGEPLAPSTPIYPITDDGSSRPGASAVLNGSASTGSSIEASSSTSRQDESDVYSPHGSGELASGIKTAPVSRTISLSRRSVLNSESSVSDNMARTAMISPSSGVMTPPTISDNRALSASGGSSSTPTGVTTVSHTAVEAVAQADTSAGTDTAHSEPLSLGRRLRNAGVGAEIHTSIYVEQRHENIGNGTANIVDQGFH